jgi:hypothetical protein
MSIKSLLFLCFFKFYFLFPIFYFLSSIFMLFLCFFYFFFFYGFSTNTFNTEYPGGRGLELSGRCLQGIFLQKEGTFVMQIYKNMLLLLYTGLFILFKVCDAWPLSNFLSLHFRATI